jgi:predicted TIM-barrel fold metal-dependent hydrolase
MPSASTSASPLSIHTSANWTRTRPSDLGHPRHIDQIACEFPDLKILMSHAGYPWVLEACLVAWRHPNVYLELGAHRPKYFAAPGAGWEQLCDEMRALPITPEAMESWLWRNASRLLKL